MSEFTITRHDEINQCEFVARGQGGAWICGARVVKMIGTGPWSVKDSGSQFHGSPQKARVFATVLRTAATEADRRNGLGPGQVSTDA